MFEGVQFLEVHTEVINRNNYMLVRIPLKRQQITGAGIEAIATKPEIKAGKKAVEVSKGEGIFPNYEIYQAIPVMKKGSWGKFNEEIYKNNKISHGSNS